LLEIVHALTEQNQPLPHILTLLCSKPSFQQRDVQESEQVSGMPEATLTQFRSGFDTQPEKTLKRFQMLQMQGESDFRAIKKQLSELLSSQLSPAVLPASVETLANGLTALSVLDQRRYSDLTANGCPTLWLLGENDPLVPAAGAEQRNHQQRLNDCGHLPMLSQPEPLAQMIHDYRTTLEPAAEENPL